MFDMNETGQKISEFRKDSNMTQMELAERLNISFQAVSTGKGKPIAGYFEAAWSLVELFGISIDELLGKSELISNIIEGDMEEFF